jgi:hypothetical protein
MRDVRAGISLFVMLSATACAASHQSAEANRPVPATGADSARASQGIQVQIDNQNFSDMNIYLVKSGGRWLVGQAEGMGKTTLTIPQSMAPADLRVRLIGDPIGGSRPVATPVLIVPRGQRVYWTIGSEPGSSTASAG